MTATVLMVETDYSKQQSNFRIKSGLRYISDHTNQGKKSYSLISVQLNIGCDNAMEVANSWGLIKSAFHQSFFRKTEWSGSVHNATMQLDKSVFFSFVMCLMTILVYCNFLLCQEQGYYICFPAYDKANC